MKQLYIIPLILILIVLEDINNIQSAKFDIPIEKTDYKDYWIKIDSLEGLGRPRSALITVEKVYQQAKKEGNADQIIKALIYQLKFTHAFDENAYSKRIQFLEDEIREYKSPVKPVLHSMLGEMYWKYYQNNRWRYYNRSATIEFDDDDLNTWELEKILRTACKHYLKSIDDIDNLNSIYLDDYFQAILDPNLYKAINKPGLYDFLCDRALAYFKSTETTIVNPADVININSKKYFVTGRDFINLSLELTDSSDQQFWVIKTYQNLVKTNQKNPESQAYYNVEYLNYLAEKSTIPNKRDILIKQINKLIEANKDSHVNNFLMYHLAFFKYSKGNDRYKEMSDKQFTSYAEAKQICENLLKKPDLREDLRLNCRAIISEITSKKLGLQLEGVYLPDETFPAKINFRNINSIYYRIIKLPYENLTRIWNEYLTKDYQMRSDHKKYIVDKLLELNPLFSQQVELPRSSDYIEHSTEVILPALPKGIYGVLVSNNEKFSYDSNSVSYKFITVSEISYIQRNLSDGELEYLVLNRKTGKLLENVKANAYSSYYNHRKKQYQRSNIGIYSSNEKGQIVIKPKDRYSNVFVDFTFNGDTLSTRRFDNWQSHGQYISPYYHNNRVKTVTHYFTDRAIYRPGQTVYFKGIVFETDNKKYQKISQDKSIEVLLMDPNYQEVSRLKVKTNEYGTFSGSFTIPFGRLNGEYRIRGYNGEKTIRIEEYKRPKFEVKFNETEGSFKLEEEITLTGKAESFAGFGITDAEVKYRVVRSVYYPYRWWYYFPVIAEEQDVANGITKTDKDGNFEISFNAIPDYSTSKNDNPVFQYTVTADITDLNGETQSGAKMVSIGYQALILKSDLEEFVKKEKLSKIEINSTNLEGVFEPVKGEIAIFKLEAPGQVKKKRLWDKPDKYLYSEEEYHKLLPGYEFQSESQIRYWKTGKQVYREEFDTEASKEVSLKGARKWNSGCYKVVIKSKDKFNQPVQLTNYFTLYSPKENHMPAPVSDLFILDRDEAKPGDKIQLLCGSSYNDISILMEIEQDGKILDERIISINENKQLFEIPIKDKYRGNVSLNYVFVKDNRFYNHTELIKVPYDNKELNISFETFRDKLAPGEKEEWRLKLSGPKGEKLAAEMVATLYDASLDQFAENIFAFNPFRYWFSELKWNSDWNFNYTNGNELSYSWNKYYSFVYPSVAQLNWFGFDYYYQPYINNYKELPGIEETGSVLVVSRKPADNVKVSGTITDLNKKPMAGVRIQVYNSDLGTISDEKGQFTLETKMDTAIILFTQDGFFTEIVEVTGKSVLSILMAEDKEGLDKVLSELYGNEGYYMDAVTGQPVARMKSAEMQFVAFAEDEVAEEALFVMRESPEPDSDKEFKEKTVLSKPKLSEIKARTDFSETAFFYPHLITNEQGEVIINFTIPESLTRWKMLGFAHTQNFKIGHISNELITKKDVMVVPNMPRFFREGDEIRVSSKIVNTSENDIEGQSQLIFFDALTMKPIDSIIILDEKIKSFKVKKGGSALVYWQLRIPSGLQAVTYRLVARAGNFTDGEEMSLPVLSNRQLVTESLPFWVRGEESRTYKLEKLINNKSTTLTHHKLTLEFTANPVWYAIQSLPYIMEYPYECMEQTFSRYYANSIATHITQSSPKIKQVFNQWQNMNDGQAFVSKLEKNQELKQLLLQETPWVLDAQSETERNKRVALLFDLNKMSNELNKALRKLEDGQYPSGGWPWFEGGPENRYITQYIVAGFGRLRKMGVINTDEDKKLERMIKRAVDYMDKELVKEYNNLKKHVKDEKLEENHLSYSAIYYMYGRSFFKDIEIKDQIKDAVHYYKKQAEKYWLKQNRYMQGIIALSLYRDGTARVPENIIISLREHAVQDEEMGMYWESPWSWFWYAAPVETQALMIEVFNEVAKDQKAVNAMRVWLLKNKQTNSWKTTKATTEACYALLLQGGDWLQLENNTEIKIAGQIIDPGKATEGLPESGTGYFKTTWSGNEVKPEMGKIELTKRDKGISWGALYWQYFEDLDKITPHETPLKLKRKLFKEVHTDKGRVIEPVNDKSMLKIGDKVIVRIELQVDRPMEFVHMKDMRGACFEPVNVISQYKWQDGLGYYESTKDASVNFFFDNVYKGTYVFEYPLWVSHEGNFSNGITTIQCMYAPEYSSHSKGIRLNVK